MFVIELNFGYFGRTKFNPMISRFFFKKNSKTRTNKGNEKKNSLAGIVLMFSGLYIVLWAKSNEISADEDQLQGGGAHDAEKALLA